MTAAIQRSITVKKNSLKRFIDAKDSQTKETFHKQYKHFRNMLLKLFLEKKNQIITEILFNLSGPI